MKNLYPKQFDKKGVCMFKFSSGWRTNWMRREGFSYRRTTTKKKKNLSAEETIAAITGFFLETRVLQRRLSGVTPNMVFNRDQVPIALAASHSTTIDDVNRDVIQDATSGSDDTKRFCSLNLTITMKVEEDLSNLVRPHLVFKATKFIKGEDQHQKDKNGKLERDQQDKRVDVSFQQNAWVDSETNLYGLSKAKIVLQKYPHSVQFEDNLSSHKTPMVKAFQEKVTCNQRFFPPDLTQVLQPIDRHVGIIYKTEVYQAIRNKSMQLLRGEGGTATTRLTPSAKRILITKTVGETHERLARSGVFGKAFLGAGTWLPSNRSADHGVRLQGVKMNYGEVITLEAVEAHQKIVQEREAREEAQRKAAKKLAEEIQRAKCEKLAPAVKRSHELWPKLQPPFYSATERYFNIIAEEVDNNFICAGSFPAAILASVYNSLPTTEDQVQLTYNDIDVYTGTFGKGHFERKECTYAKLNGLDVEINIINCTNLNLEAIIENCDINAVSVFVNVGVEKKRVVSTEVVTSPEFWDFLVFDHTLRSWSTDSPARTLVRLAYKSYQMELPYAEGTLSLLDGEVFASHKKKVEEMELKWEDYPFSNYQLKKKTKKSFKFRKYYTECPCGRKGNLYCISEKCSKCCRKQVSDCKVHKIKNPVIPVT